MEKRKVDKNVSRRQMLKLMGKAGLFMGSYPFARNLLNSEGWAWAGQTKPKNLIYSTYGGDYAKWVKESFEDPFTTKTGIALVKDIGKNPDRLSKLRLQSTRPYCDIVALLDRFMFQADYEGLLSPLNPSNFENLKDIYPAYVHKSWVPYWGQSIGIVYNTKYVKKEIKSWYDIFDEAFRGKTFIDDISHFGVHCLVAFAKLKGGDENNIDPGFKLLSKFKKMLNPRIITTSQEGMHVFRTEQMWIGVWQKARAIRLKREGLPIKFVSPIEGDVSLTTGHAVAKASKHKEWVEKYIDKTLDPANQSKFTKFYPAFPTNKKAKLPTDLEAEIGYTEEELARQIHIDYSKVIPQLDHWVERWNKEIARKG